MENLGLAIQYDRSTRQGLPGGTLSSTLGKQSAI